jgi:hypothetical protein
LGRRNHLGRSDTLACDVVAMTRPHPLGETWLKLSAL